MPNDVWIAGVIEKTQRSENRSPDFVNDRIAGSPRRRPTRRTSPSCKWKFHLCDFVCIAWQVLKVFQQHRSHRDLVRQLYVPWIRTAVVEKRGQLLLKVFVEKCHSSLSVGKKTSMNSLNRTIFGD